MSGWTYSGCWSDTRWRPCARRYRQGAWHTVHQSSFHLKAIVHSGLVDVEREGRFMRYRANIPLMLEIVAYLTEECCSGNPEACQRFRDASPARHILPGR